jgi:transcription antitermination factor NusG
MIADPNAKNWYVIKTKPFYEKKAYANLDKKGFNVFLPLMETMRQWSDRKKKIQVPLIPSVVFINCSQNELRHIYGEIGISSVLKYLKKPAVVKDYEIENLRILVEQFEGQVISTKQESILSGQLVEVIEGPFIGLVAESIVVNGKHRIKVKISVLNTEYIVNIPCSYVRALTSEVA